MVQNKGQWMAEHAPFLSLLKLISFRSLQPMDNKCKTKMRYAAAAAMFSS